MPMTSNMFSFMQTIEIYIKNSEKTFSVEVMQLIYVNAVCCAFSTSCLAHFVVDC